MKAWIVIGMLVLLATGCDRQPARVEPTFKGKPGHEWVKLLGDNDNATRLDAIEAVAAMPAVDGGIDGLKTVMRADASWKHRDAAADALWKNFPNERGAVLDSVQAWLKDDDARIRWQAGETLKEFGAEAAPALPALKATAKADASEWVRDKATEAVKAITAR